MQKKTIYIDLDGVLADFDQILEGLCPDINQLEGQARSKKVREVCLSKPYFFQTLPPITGAIEAVKRLFELYEVYFLSTPMWEVPTSYTEKRLWVEEHFGVLAEKRLILTHRKDLVIGDILIDDRPNNGASNFQGLWIHFGSLAYPDWKTILAYLEEYYKHE